MLPKSKLISILRTLSNKELKRFEEFIVSPFFNKNTNVITLFNLVKKFHPEYEEDKVSAEKIYVKIFPKEKFDEQKLRYVMTDLTKLLEEFLSFMEYDKNEVNKRRLLLNLYDQRKLDKYFQATLDVAKDLLKKQPYRDVNYYFNQHLLEENGYLHSLSRDSRTLEDSLQQAVDDLDMYYLSNKLRFCCVIFNREDILQVKYNNILLDEILSFLSKNNFDNVPAISIYYQILMTFREREHPEHYQKLKELLEAHIDKFPLPEAKDMYVFALNYCIKKLNSGKLEYLHELFSLYKILIEKEIIFENEELAPSDFKNIVTVGLRTGQVEWTEKFIHNYKNRIPSELRENTYLYNLAFLHYYKKEFSKALKLLQTVDFNDIYYNLDAKSLLLKTYYELDEEEPFFSLVDAFSTYLKRNKLISDYQRTVYLNFVKYAKKLMHIKIGGRVSLQEVKDELKELKQVASLQWLLEKAEELSK